MNSEIRPDELLRLLPPVRRARGYHLYGAGGERFLDLWQEDGRGVLGAKGFALGTLAKDEIDRGILAPLGDRSAETRLSGEILSILPEYKAVRIFQSEAQACARLAAAGGLGAQVHEPARIRPFSEFERGYVRGTAGSPALFILPCPAFLSPAALLFSSEKEASAFVSDLLAPVQLKAGYKALREFRAYRAKFSEEIWKSTDRYTADLFDRSGPLLYPRGHCAEPLCYAELFRSALAAGILLSPSPERPSIIPGEFSPGELKKLTKLAI